MRIFLEETLKTHKKAHKKIHQVLPNHILVVSCMHVIDGIFGD
jgi:hypothetical protein